MKKFPVFPCLAALLSFLLILFGGSVSAQQSLLSCSKNAIPMVNGLTFPASTFKQTSSSTGGGSWGTHVLFNPDINTPANVLDNNLANYAAGNVIINGSVTMSIVDSAHNYSIGDFAGFLIQRSGLIDLTVLGNLRISTYLGGVLQESKTGNELLVASAGSSGKYEVGIYTNKPFNRVEIRITSAITLGETYNVYHAVIKGTGSCASPTLTCNRNTKATFPAIPAVVNPLHTGSAGLSGSVFANTDYVTDADTTNAATITTTISLAGSAFLSVKDVVTDYPSGTYAGFDVENASLVAASILSSVRIRTYLNDTLQEDMSGNGLLLGATLLGNTGRHTVGFVTTKAFDEIQFVIDQGLVSVSLGQTSVYGAVFKKLCAGPVLPCNTNISLKESTYPVVVDDARTGVSGAACVACKIFNTGNLLDEQPNTAAVIDLTAGVGVDAKIAVKDQITDYPAGTFAGFDLQNSGLLAVNALDNIRITIYKDGVQKQTKIGGGNTGLLSVSSALLTGSSRQTVGFVSDSVFDEVQLTFSKTALLDLGITSVYGVVLKSLCAGDITCNSSIKLINPTYPAVVNIARTGVNNAVCALCTVQNTDNVVDGDTSNFATISVLAAVASPGSISVRDVKSTYPAGTFAGFNVASVNSIIQLDLFNSITIATYRNDTLQESKTGDGSIINPPTHYTEPNKKV